jgi:hypothetical protein
VEYDESSSNLATTGDFPDWFVPDPGEWRTDTVDLSGFSGEPNVLIGFVNISGWGNNLYLDNVNVHGGGSPGDQDGDGYTVANGDCDDSDASVHPNAPEDCGDGADNDCDGDTDGADSDCAGDDDAGDDDAGDDDAGDDDAGDDDAGDDDAGDDDGGDDDAGDDDGGDDDTSGDDDDDDGAIIAGQDCSCQSNQSTVAAGPGVALWLGLLGLAVALRARR